MIRILLVEDEPRQRDVLARLFRSRLDVEVLEAASAEEAAHVQGPIDVVVCDWSLPNNKTARDVRPMWPDALFIVLSGYDAKPDFVEHWLVKPFKMAQFEQLLDYYFPEEA